MRLAITNQHGLPQVRFPAPASALFPAPAPAPAVGWSSLVAPVLHNDSWCSTPSSPPSSESSCYSNWSCGPSPLPIADGKSSPAAACLAWEDSSMCSDYAWEFAEGIYPPSGTSIRSAESSSALSRSTTQFADQIALATTAASSSISLSPVECTSSSTESAGSLDAPDSRHGLEIAQGTDQSSTSRGAWELALDEIFRALLF